MGTEKQGSHEAVSEGETNTRLGVLVNLGKVSVPVFDITKGRFPEPLVLTHTFRKAGVSKRSRGLSFLISLTRDT